MPKARKRKNRPHSFFAGKFDKKRKKMKIVDSTPLGSMKAHAKRIESAIKTMKYCKIREQIIAVKLRSRYLKWMEKKINLHH
jgi:hypothetical protein